MSIAAVPSYLGQDLSSASPGMRFGMYLKLWGVNRRSQTVLWTTADVDYEVRGQNQQEREVKHENKVPALAEAKRLNENDKKIMAAVRSRQDQLFTTVPATEGLCLDATAIAPFTTGLGNEHALENGFAFLNPYGLPYLPGSGVKGVLRQAARELAGGDWGDACGWNIEPRFPLLEGPADRRKPLCDKNKQPILLTQTDVLFGRETPAGESDHLRGVLSFWDVMPQIEGDSLAVEIMTPHQGHYYQQRVEPRSGNSATPHESGSPNPISFLTVPAGSAFAFHVVCDLPRLRRLAPELARDDQWKALLTAAFEDAFAWLGFGAKTAVGYGAMRSPAQRERRDQERAQREAEEKDKARQQLEQTQREQAEAWPDARLKFNRGNGALTAEKNGKSALALKPKGEELLSTLPAEIRNKVTNNQFVKVTAYVHQHTLVRIEP